MSLHHYVTIPELFNPLLLSGTIQHSLRGININITICVVMNSVVIASENVFADQAQWSDGVHVIYPGETAAYEADFPEEIFLCGLRSPRGFTVLNSISKTIKGKRVKGLYFTLATDKDLKWWCNNLPPLYISCT